MVVSLLLTLGGVVLVGFTYLDVFLTVLHPQAESPFSSRLHTGLWRVLRGSTRSLRGRARHRILGLALPLGILGLMTGWITLLLIGYSLIYGAWIALPGAFHVPDLEGIPDWGDALYFSGVTLTTVGYGDLQPLHPWLRLVAVIEGFSGIGVLSLSVAYVLEVYPVLQRESVLAILLNEETAGQVDALPLLTRYLEHDNFEALGGLLRTINSDVLLLAEAHRRLPVLHYAHPIEVERSFLRILLVLHNLVGALRYGVASEHGRVWSADPRVRALEDSLFYTLYTLGSSLHLPVAAETTQSTAEDAITFQNLCAQLTVRGLPTPGPLPRPGTPPATPPSAYDQACAAFVRYRQAGDRALSSYQRNSGYTVDEATAPAPRPQRLVNDLDTGEGIPES